LKFADNTLDRLRLKLLAWPGLRNVQAAEREDLVHDVLRSLLESDSPKLAAFSDEQLTRYAFAILRNLRALLFRRRFIEHRARTKRGLARGEQTSALPAPFEAMVEKERAAGIMRVVSQLPERSRRILSLRNQGLKFDEIAARLGISSVTARQLYIRTLQRVRDAYFGQR